jgi:hypothetical protein
VRLSKTPGKEADLKIASLLQTTSLGMQEGQNERCVTTWIQLAFGVLADDFSIGTKNRLQWQASAGRPPLPG